MAPPIKLTRTEYERIRADLIATHGKKIIINWVCKREAGFTFREHWDGNNSGWYVDFYNDAAETMFRLKYL